MPGRDMATGCRVGDPGPVAGFQGVIVRHPSAQARSGRRCGVLVRVADVPAQSIPSGALMAVLDYLIVAIGG